MTRIVQLDNYLFLLGGFVMIGVFLLRAIPKMFGLPEMISDGLSAFLIIAAFGVGESIRTVKTNRLIDLLIARRVTAWVILLLLSIVVALGHCGGVWLMEGTIALFGLMTALLYLLIDSLALKANT